MKSIALVFIVMAVVVGAVATVSAEEPWLDPMNCDMCKNMIAEDGLLQHMTTEVCPTSMGLIWMNMVPADYLDAYRRASANMDKTGEAMMAGKEMHLCGCCQNMGKLMMSGAHMEKVATKEGSVMLVTATDPEVVKAIHAHAERSNMEMAKMAESMEKGQTH